MRWKMINDIEATYILSQPHDPDEIDKEPGNKQVGFSLPDPVHSAGIRNLSNNDVKILSNISFIVNIVEYFNTLFNIVKHYQKLSNIVKNIVKQC